MSINYKGSKGKINVKEDEIKYFEPVYLKFNFSYLHKDCIELNENQALCVMNTILTLSNRPFLQISSERKASGFESIPVKNFCKKQMCQSTELDSACGFEKDDRKLSEKRDVFRIKDVKLGRMIGKIYRHIFYVFYLDFDGEAYDHGR